ncbi:uncharacterized protein LOC109915657 [Rhincodon typus]|uniref:uncharacterized protein LOC109915657 n=1 Tax=Rhincodon typus TaxID=259920 RepID=UPI002030ECB7|nr:uncharacterized protein LOC109915657 [Rhincodon typus]XP_048468041.1 uncharacterized protein LOC109915657 [Rhincodon typus]
MYGITLITTSTRKSDVCKLATHCPAKMMLQRGVQFQNRHQIRNRTYIYSDYIYNSPTPLIYLRKKGDALFVKTSGMARGSVGVLTYAFGYTQFSLLFSNPYDYNLYSTVLALYIPIEPEMTDEKLYYKMYYELEPSCCFARVELGSGTQQTLVRGGNGAISATVTKMGNCSISTRDVYSADDYKSNFFRKPSAPTIMKLPHTGLQFIFFIYSI